MRDNPTNRFGVDVKRGAWVIATHPRGGDVSGRVVSIKREDGRGVVVKLDSGFTVALDDVQSSLGRMTVGRDGTVRQNPAKPRTFLVTRTDSKTGEEFRRPESYLFKFTVYLDNRALQLVAHTDEFNHLIVSDPESGMRFTPAATFYAHGMLSDREAAKDAAEKRVAQLTAAGKARYAWERINQARAAVAALPVKD